MAEKIQDLMKKHPLPFVFDFHPIRFAKRLSESEEALERELRSENDSDKT